MSPVLGSDLSSAGSIIDGASTWDHPQIPIAHPAHSHDAAVIQTAIESAHRSKLTLPQDEEIRFDLDGVPYLAPDLPLGSVSGIALSGERYEPVTVISIPTPNGNSNPNITSIIEDSLGIDDVLSKAWLASLIVTTDTDSQGSKTVDTVVEEQDRLRSHFGVDKILIDDKIEGDIPDSPETVIQKVELETSTMPPRRAFAGPVLGKSEEHGSMSLLPVYQLQPDKYRTFLFGVYSLPDGSFKAVRHVDPDGYTYIPIPSRLASKCDKEEDDGVCGRRFAVKDLFDLEGVKTSAGIREYGNMRGKANATASSIQILSDEGGVPVAKAKTAAHAVGSYGNNDTVDEQYPFTPRGDRWQGSMGSSSGPAAAMGAYPWLDASIGTDTTGSMRGPGAEVGLYATRPSHRAVELDGVTPSVPFLDTAGVFVRDPKELGKLIKTWYANSPLNLTSFTGHPTRVLIDKSLGERFTDAAWSITEDFFGKLQTDLGLEVSKVNLTESLAKANWSLERVQNEVSGTDRWYSWTHCGKPFREQYAAEHDGQLPPTDPAIRAFWDKAEVLNATKDEYDSIPPNLESLAAYVNDEFLGRDEETCSENLYVHSILPWQGHPFYREADMNEEVLNEPSNPDGFMSQLLCPLTGCADYTIPIGQVPYLSEISRQEEMSPVSLQIVAPKGCDFMLADFVKTLADTGLIKSVKTGRTAF